MTKILTLIVGMYTGILDCIVKLSEEVCASHTKEVGENKKVLQFKYFTDWFYLKNSEKN